MFDISHVRCRRNDWPCTSQAETKIRKFHIGMAFYFQMITSMCFPHVSSFSNKIILIFLAMFACPCDSSDPPSSSSSEVCWILVPVVTSVSCTLLHCRPCRATVRLTTSHQSQPLDSDLLPRMMLQLLSQKLSFAWTHLCLLPLQTCTMWAFAPSFGDRNGTRIVHKSTIMERPRSVSSFSVEWVLALRHSRANPLQMSRFFSRTAVNDRYWRGALGHPSLTPLVRRKGSLLLCFVMIS